VVVSRQGTDKDYEGDVARLCDQMLTCRHKVLQQAAVVRMQLHSQCDLTHPPEAVGGLSYGQLHRLQMRVMDE
jgi:hypothetical protein